MNIEYIIIQAGGKGTRMEHLTYNKPKALVPVNNLPMIFHLFRKYPNSKYMVIGDYKYDVLKKYMEAFAEVESIIIDARGKKGTCAGIDESLKLIPNDKPFMLIWSDLILSDEYEMPMEEANYVGISKDFRCRWSFKHGEFVEEASEAFGVAGHFIFKNKGELVGIPSEGEFVRWLRERKIKFNEIALFKTKEYGLLSEYNKLEVSRCRPFNQIIIDGNTIIKEGIDEQGKALAVREVAWYDKIKEAHFDNIPKIYATNPLKMELIDGKNIFAYNFSFEQKKDVLEQLISCIKQIHGLESAPYDEASYQDAYLDKTYKRLEKVYDMVPFAQDEVILINGKKCKNVFFHKDELKTLIDRYKPSEFVLLHGDCTFSNMLLKNGKIPVMIDPRGYFGHTELYGDPAYDWVKIYYSLVGNYDQFNLRRFKLKIEEREVLLDIESNHWEDMEETFFELLGDEVTISQMKVLHSIIWLSLTTYAWEDYDSICGAFYNGLLYLNEVI